jgi:hypothetical protein
MRIAVNLISKPPVKGEEDNEEQGPEFLEALEMGRDGTDFAECQWM